MLALLAALAAGSGVYLVYSEMFLGQRGFDGLLERVPGFAKKLLAGLARRLRQEDAKSVS